MGRRRGEGDQGDEELQASRGLSRRSFLKTSGLGAMMAGSPGILVGCKDKKKGLAAKPSTIEVHVVRPDDMVVAAVSFQNVLRQGDQIVRQGSDARLRVTLPRQHILEQTLNEGADPTPPPLESRLSGPSRLVLRMPDGVDQIPYTLESVLEAIRTWDVAVATNATPAPGAEPKSLPLIVHPVPLSAKTGRPDARALIRARRRLRRKLALDRYQPATTTAGVGGPGDLASPDLPGSPVEPTSAETAIELPTRLLLSPNRHARFANAVTPVESETGRVELWHTRLAAKTASGGTDEKDADLRTVRALWARPHATLPSAPLTDDDRQQIVRLSSDFELDGPGGQGSVVPAPIQVDRMMLTALGGYLDARAEFPEADGLNVEAWSHLATLGRDHYVRIVRQGYLFPFGHPASLVIISERKIVDPPPRTAYLWKRAFLIIREPVQRYDAGANLDEVGRVLRQMPFAAVAMRELITPNLDEPPDGTMPFLPRVQSRAYRFPVDLVDRAGRVSKAGVAAVWVPGRPAETWGQHAQAARQLLDQTEAGTPITRTLLDGQRVMLAESDGDETTLETHYVDFASPSDPPGSEMQQAGYEAPFLPLITQASVAVEATRNLTGQGDGQIVQFFQSYIDHGFADGNGQNPGQVFLEMVEQALPVSFAGSSDKSGGFLTPDLSVTGLSRLTGPVGGALETAASGSFDAEEFFKDALPKLFGVIPLTDIIDIGQALDKAPKFLTDVADEVESLLEELARLDEHLDQLKDEVAALFMKAQAALDQIGEVVSRIASFDIAWLFPPGTGLSDLETLLLDVLQGIAAEPAVPPGIRNFAEKAIDKVLVVIRAVDILQQAIERVQEAKELIENRVIRLEFRPTIKGDPLGIFVPQRTDGLLLGAEIRGKATGSKPAGADLICSLEDFEVRLVGDDPAFTIAFERLQFLLESGKKPALDVVFGGLTFGGPLSFIERIKDIIPLDGFSDPPAIEVSLAGIKASFSLPLPNVAVGVFSLENISISAGFEIPFLGEALTVNFGFCSRENPFVLTVSMLGGGGFVGITLSPDGIRLLEISLEFGASLSVDFGVASGGISIMAGLYFAVEDNVPTLTGYLRFRGEITVLGIISASLELAMELTYEGATGKVIGRASLKIEVRVLCFSAGVTLEVERKFAGSNGDPTFAEVMAPCPPPALPTDACGPDTPWADYVNAFAA